GGGPGVWGVVWGVVGVLRGFLPPPADQRAAFLPADESVIAAKASHRAAELDAGGVDDVVEGVAGSVCVSSGARRLLERQVFESVAERPARIDRAHGVYAAGIRLDDVARVDDIGVVAEAARKRVGFECQAGGVRVV